MKPLSPNKHMDCPVQGIVLVGFGKERGKALAHQSQSLSCEGGQQAITSAEQGELHLSTGSPGPVFPLRLPVLDIFPRGNCF